MALKDLFKKKPGGTVVGNIIRAAARTATAAVFGRPVLGLGANMIPKDGGQNPIKAGFDKAVGKGLAAFAENVPEPVSLGSGVGAGIGGKNVEQGFKIQVMFEKLKKYWYLLLLLLVLVFYFLFSKRKGGFKVWRK